MCLGCRRWLPIQILEGKAKPVADLIVHHAADADPTRLG
jgi:hypothetical protein